MRRGNQRLERTRRRVVSCPHRGNTQPVVGTLPSAYVGPAYHLCFPNGDEMGAIAQTKPLRFPRIEELAASRR